MKIMYTDKDTGILAIVVGAPKAHIERTLGKFLTDKEYDQMVLNTVPADALNVKEIQDEDVPSDRQFRDAWVDVTPDNKVNIDLNKAKAIQLDRLRKARNEALLTLDPLYIRALEQGDVEKQKDVIDQKNALRGATDALKALGTEGVDDAEVLNQIIQLGTLEQGN